MDGNAGDGNMKGRIDIHRFRLHLLVPALVLPALIWLAWPRSPEPEVQHIDPQTRASGKRLGSHELGNEATYHPKRLRSIRTMQMDEADKAALMRVESLVADPGLENHEAALELLMIAQDKRLSEKVRAEALEHGVLLDLPTFAGMAADDQMPLEMADTLLTHVINENQDEALQIRSYRDFLNHPSPEIHDQALQMLRFVVGDRDESEDEASLRRMAVDKLGELEK